MSHPLYNPYALENQRSSQGQYGLSGTQAGVDHVGVSSRLDPGSVLGSTGAPSGTSISSGGRLSSVLPQSNYGPGQSRSMLPADIGNTIDMHISRAREEIRFLSQSMQRPKQATAQASHLAGTPREETLSSGVGMTGYHRSSPSASLGHSIGHTDKPSGSSSLDWLSDYQRTTTDASSNFYSPSSLTSSSAQNMPLPQSSQRSQLFQTSNYAVSSDGSSSASSSRRGNMLSISELDYPESDKPATLTEPSRPKYTSESAATILRQFGLSKEDLEHLISYPEDQITPANLPFILRQIRIQKAKRSAAAVDDTMDHQPQHSGGMSRLEHVGSSDGAGIRKEEMASVGVRQLSKVIDYGHTGKYTAGLGEEVSGKSSSIGASSGGSDSKMMDTYSSSSRSPESRAEKRGLIKCDTLGSSHDPRSAACSLGSSYTSILSSVSPQRQELTKQTLRPDQISQRIPVSISLPKKKNTDSTVFESEASKPIPVMEPEADRQPASKTHPTSTLVRGVNPNRPGLVVLGSKVDSGNKDQSPTQAKRLVVGLEGQKKQQTHQPQQMPKQQTQVQMQSAVWPPVFSAMKTVPPAPHIHSVTDVSFGQQPSVFHPGGTMTVRPSDPTIPPLMTLMPLPPSIRHNPATSTAGKKLPTPSMMTDYTAATPRIFPHTCSLCNKECAQMKDWIAHQNTNLHLENCKFLRHNYPDWDGEITHLTSPAGRDAKPSTSSSSLTSQQRSQKTRHGSRSRSRSRSRPRSHSRSRSCSRSRSHSPRRYHGTTSRKARELYRPRSRSPYSSRYTRRSHSRSRSRSCSPRRDPHPSSSYWRRSRSRSHERRSSPGRSTGHRQKSNSAERLAKKLLETSAAQSLSHQTNLEAVVKSLAPALLAELSKMKSSSSSSSQAGKHSSSPPSTTTKRPSSATSSSSSSSEAKKKVSSNAVPREEKLSSGRSETSSSTKTTVESGRRSSKSAGMVKLQGVPHSVSHKEVVSAVEQFGKTTTVLLLRKVASATVCFEREEDAKAMSTCKDFRIKGFPVIIVTDKDNNSKEPTMPPEKEQKKPPEKKLASTTSKNHTEKSTSSTTTAAKKAPLPTPKQPPASSPAGTKNTAASTTKNVTSQKTAAEASSKGPGPGISKEKALVSKAKTTTTKQPTKTQPGKVAAKGTLTKVTTVKTTTSTSKSKAPENKPDVSDSKQKKLETPKLDKSETNGKDSPVMSKGCEDAVKASATTDMTVAEIKHQTEQHKVESEVSKSKEVTHMEAKLEETGVEVEEPMKVESFAKDKGAKLDTKVETTEVSAEKSKEKQPLTSMADPKSNVSSPVVPTPSPKAIEAKLKSLDNKTQSPQIIAKSPEMSAQAAAPEAPQSTLPDLDSTVKELETKEESLETKQQETRTPAKAAVKETSNDSSDEQLETNTSLKAPKQPEDGLPDGKESAAEAAILTAGVAVPVGSTGPFGSVPSSVSAEQTESRSATSSPAASEAPAELPQVNKDMFKALTAAVRQHRLTRQSQEHSREKESHSRTSRSQKSKDSPQTESHSRSSRSKTHKSEHATPKQSQGLQGADFTDDSQPDSCLFEREDFDFSDFVTVDEVGDDAEDANASSFSPLSSHSDSHGSAKTASTSKQSSNTTRAEETLRSSPTSKQSSKEKQSSKDPTKNSTPSLSSSYSNEGKSTHSLSKSTPSSNSSLVSSPSKSKDLPEATSTATTSSTSPSKVSNFSSLPSVKPHSSFAHKTQSKTTTAVAKSPVKTPSAGLANSGVRTRASSAATKMPKGDLSEELRAASAVTEGVVVKSDHQVLAETTLAKSVKSETKMDTSSEMQSSPQGEELGLASQTHTGSFLLRSDTQSQGGFFSPLESGSNEETLKKDLKKTSDEGKEDSIENSKEAEEDESEGYQILDSLDDQAGEEMNCHLRDQDGSSETQLTEPRDSPTLNDETYEVLDSVDDEGKTCQEDDNKMAMNGSFRVLDSVIEDKTTVDREDNQLIKDDKEMVLKPSEEEMLQTNKSDDKSTIKGTIGKEDETSKEAHSQVVDSVSEQSPKDGEDGKKRNKKAEVDKCKTASTESSQDTNKAAKDNVENQDGQIPNKEAQNLDFPRHSTDTVKTPECTIQEQKTFEILNSVDDKTTTEDHNQRHETGQVLESPSGQMVVKDVRQIEEGEEDGEEETYEVIDSVEDQLVTTAQMETEKKEKTTKRGKRTARKEDKPTNGSGSSTRLSKNDEKSPKKEVKKYNTQRKKINTPTGTSEKEEEAQEVIEGSMLQVVDSVEDEPGQDAVNNTAGFSRRRSARRNKEDNATPNLTGALEKMDREEEEEATYEILDSVEDETVNYDPPATERSDSRKMERTTKKEVKNEDIKTLQKEGTPTRKRHTPARDSAERNREKTPKIEDKVTKKESTPTKTSDIVLKEVSEEEATYQILDSVEDETVNDDPIITQRSGGRGRRGRAKKMAQRTKKGSTPLKKNDKDAPEEAIGEEEATYQVLDSLEDETADDPTPAEPSERGRRERAKKEDKMTKNTDKQTQSSDSLAASTKNKEEEEEPVYQVVDAVEEDKVHVQDPATTEGSDRRRKERISEKKDTPTKTSSTTMGASEKIVVQDDALYKVVDSVEEDPTPQEESGRRRKERTPKKEAKKEDKLPQKSQSNLSPLESEKKDKSHKKGGRTEDKQKTTTSVLVNLDEVSEEEEDYPDDTAEEEELRKRQAAAKEKQLAIEREREEKRVREKEERERRSSSRGGKRRVKGRGREREKEEEKVGVDPKELVTLDEVGADEAEEEVGGAPRSQEMDGGITEGDLQALFTLDEIVGEEEEEPTLLEPLPPSQEDESGDFFNPETLVTLDEAGCEEDEKKEKQAEKTSSVVKRKRNMDKTEESINFLTVDEVGAEEEEEVTTRGRGQTKKRMRQTPVRKSTRGKQASMKEEKVEERTPPAADVSPPASLDTSSSLVKEEPVSSGDSQPEVLKTEAEEGATQSSLGDSSARQELQPRSPESHNAEDGAEIGEELKEKKEEEARSRVAIKVFSKRRREVVELQAKRSRSQSPSVPADFKLPPFRPNNPLGLEFVVPQRGFICNLCSMFYLNESVAKETHCSSRRHYDSMQKYYQKLQEEQSRHSRGGSAPGLSSD